MSTTGGVIQLKQLVKTEDNYIAKNGLTQDNDPDAAFYINLCRPLNPMPDTQCPAGAGACMVSSNGDIQVCYGLNVDLLTNSGETFL